jgi:hypothetical protein
MFLDPQAPAVVTYDPPGMLAGLAAAGGSELACRDELSRIVMHLGRLVSLVRDFPESALMSVRAAATAPVQMADVDWNTVARRMEAAEREVAGQQVERAMPSSRRWWPWHPSIRRRSAAAGRARCATQLQR